MTTRARSVSQANTYGRCGTMYDLERNKRVPKKQAAWFCQGLAVHTAIEKWEKQFREPELGQVLDWYQEAWAENIEAMKAKEPDIAKWMTGGNKKAVNDVRDREVLGKEQTTMYYYEALKSDLVPWEYTFGKRASEVPFEIQLDDVTVRGVIDLIMVSTDKRFVIEDIKTGTKEPIGILQFATYKIAVEKQFGLTINWARYWLCKDGAHSKPYDLRPYDEAWVTERYRRMDQAESQGLFLPNPGDNCRVCLVAEYCDEIQPYPLEIPALNY